MRTKKHCKVNQKSHDMKTRKWKIQIQCARTVNLKKSAVIYMQNIIESVVKYSICSIWEYQSIGKSWWVDIHEHDLIKMI